MAGVHVRMTKPVSKVVVRIIFLRELERHVTSTVTASRIFETRMLRNAQLQHLTVLCRHQLHVIVTLIVYQQHMRIMMKTKRQYI